MHIAYLPTLYYIYIAEGDPGFLDGGGETGESRRIKKHQWEKGTDCAHTALYMHC